MGALLSLMTMAGRDAITRSSSYVEYLLACWKSSSINAEGFREMELKNYESGFKTYIIESMLTAYSWWIIPPKRLMKSRRDSPLFIVARNKPAMLCFCLTEHKYLVANVSDSSRNEDIDPRGRR